MNLDLTIALRHADQAARIAQSYGYPMPAEWGQQTAVAAAAKQIADEPEPIIPVELPAADKLPAFITKLAGERDKCRTRVAVAADIHDRATRAAARVAIDHAPHVAHHLAEQANQDVLPRLITLLDTAPHEIGGYENPEQLAAYSELLRTVGEASLIVHNRGELAAVTGEAADLGRTLAWLLIDPAGDALISAIDTAITHVTNDGLPATLDAWRMLRPLGLQLAYPGEAAARRDSYHAARANMIATPDGGMRDHTISELAKLAGDPEAARRVRAFA